MLVNRIFFCLVILLTILSSPAFSKTETKLRSPAGPTIEEKEAIEKTRSMITEIIDKAYPELKKSRIRVKAFESKTNYFKARFSITRLVTFQSKGYIIYVNPLVFQNGPPVEGIRAIIAHELAHVLYYKDKKICQLIGLISLVDNSFTARFERKADLTAIERGFGEGLKKYRVWLYQNIPADDLREKKRDYFTPPEIDLILEKSARRPELFGIWRRNVPRRIEDIK